MRYPFVLLDAGGTILGPRVSYGAVYARELRGCGVEADPALLDGAIGEAARRLASLVPPGADRFAHFLGGESGYWRTFVDEVLERTVPEAPPELAARALDRLYDAFSRPDTWRVYDDVVPALEALRRAGARLGVVSNWDSRLPRLLESLGLAGHFEVLAVSHLEGIEKPDPGLFRRALARLGAPPGRTLHVGDAPALDIAGAQAAGITGLLVDRSGGRRGEPAVLPDLRDLPRIAEEGV